MPNLPQSPPELSPLRRAGRPKAPLAPPAHLITRRVRRLVDRVHAGNLREASQLTGLPYPTLRDLYIGVTTNPGLGTLETLREPYGLGSEWFTNLDEPAQGPKEGLKGLVPPKPAVGARGRSLREILIPCTAWPMYEIMAKMERRLASELVGPDRSIVAEATGDAFTFRLTTFLLQPLLAVEKMGLESIILTLAEFESGADGSEVEARDLWVRRLRALGGMWHGVLGEFLGD